MKTSNTASVLLALALSSIAVASPGKSHSHSRNHVDANDFVKVDGLRLKDSKDQSVYLTGINYWACMNLAADKEAGGQYERFSEYPFASTRRINRG